MVRFNNKLNNEPIKQCLVFRCSMAAWFLGLRSYLFGDDHPAATDDANGANDDNNNNGEDAAAAQDVDALPDEVAGVEVEEDADLDDDDAWEADEDDEEEDFFDDEDQPDLPQANPGDLPGPFGNPLGAAHAALIHREARTGVQEYTKPDFFPLRVSFFSLCLCSSLMVFLSCRLRVSWC